MATGKSSFVLYTDYHTIFDQLTNEEAGKIIKHLFKYVNDKEPELEDRMLKILFEPIKQQLKRDLRKWDKKKKVRAEIGRIGGIKSGKARSKTKQNEAIGSNSKQNEANEAVTGNGTVTVNVNDTVIEGGVFDAEKEILSNKIQLEKICMNTKNPDFEHVKHSLRKFHLHLEENDKYPQKRKQIFAGFEKWLLNEKKSNGTHQQTLGTSESRVDKLKKWGG